MRMIGLCKSTYYGISEILWNQFVLQIFIDVDYEYIFIRLFRQLFSLSVHLLSIILSFTKPKTKVNLEQTFFHT